MDFIEYKKIRIDKYGDEIRSLIDKIISDMNVRVVGKGRVKSNEIMRPDKIAYKWYGNTKYDWIFLKFNGLSNPLTLDEGFEYLVPNIDDVFEKIGIISNDLIEEVEIDLEDKQSSIDPRKILYNKKKTTDTVNEGVTLNGTTLTFGSNNIGGNEVIINEPTTPVTTDSIPEECTEVCENEDPELCALCKCNPKLSDVLNYKILKDSENN
jgi:hypothetical protein